MINTITLKDECTGEKKTLQLRQPLEQVAQAATQATLAIAYGQQAYLVRHRLLGTFLCLQQGARSAYYSIAPEPTNIMDLKTECMTDIFRYTGHPVCIPPKEKKE